MPENSDPVKPRGSYAKGIARRQEILDRAIEVFARRGSDKTSLRAIAREVGVTHAALTHYFGSLDELLVAVYQNSEKRAGDVVPSKPGATPVEMMLESARANREVPGLVQLYSTLVAAGLEEDRATARDFATARFAGLRQALAARVRENQHDGRIRNDVDPIAVAALVIAASDGLQTQWLLDPAVPQDDALALLEELLHPPEAPEVPSRNGA
jgi:AcrR family transcriptional regulator